MSDASALYVGEVHHTRLKPLRHRLRYRVFSLLLDVDELDTLDRRLRWFSLGRFNLFSLHPGDYGSGDAATLRESITTRLAAAGIRAEGAIRLLTMPRILGYAFNPLSVWFCHAPDGRLAAILYEVNNTFGDRHDYLIEAQPSDDGVVRQACAKRMHVSPFLPLDLRYGFRIEPPSSDAPSLSIAVKVHDDHGAVLNALHTARRRPLDDAGLLQVFATHPLLTLRVIAAIHWQALKLWLKGARFHRRPAPPAAALTHVAVRPDLPAR